MQKSSDLNTSEVFVAQRLLGCDSVLGVQLEHALDDFQAVGGNLGEQVFQILLSPFRERGFGVGQFLYSRPLLRAWGPEHREDLEDLLNFVAVAHEEGLSGEHLDEDAAYSPDIDCSSVLLLPEENLRSSIPQRFYLMGECLLRDHYQSCKSKICDFNIFLVDKRVQKESTRIFCGLRSLWSTFLEWMKATPLSIFLITTLIFSSSILQSLLVMNFLRSCSQQSNTILSICSLGLQMTSRRGTILGWSFRVFRSEIYRSALEGIPYSQLSNLMYFTATGLLFLSRALQTLPNAPSPIWHISLYPYIFLQILNKYYSGTINHMETQSDNQRRYQLLLNLNAKGKLNRKITVSINY